MTILGLYQWDPTIFDDMQLPASVDKNTLINNIVLECSGLEITLPNSDIFKRMLTVWSNSKIEAWDRIASALDLEYEVIHNYDRTETHTEKIITDRNESWHDTENNTMNQTSGGADTVTNKTAAFDGDNLAVAGENKTEYGGTAKTTNNNTQNGTQGVDEEITRSNSIRAYGNIGVTTSTQMLEQEMQFRQHYNIYEIITDDFRKQFCICIY